MGSVVEAVCVFVYVSVCVCVFKAKHALTIGPGNSSPRNRCKRNKNICPQKDLYVNAESNIIHIVQNCNKQKLFQLENEPKKMYMGTHK